MQVLRKRKKRKEKEKREKKTKRKTKRKTKVENCPMKVRTMCTLNRFSRDACAQKINRRLRCSIDTRNFLLEYHRVDLARKSPHCKFLEIYFVGA